MPRCVRPATTAAGRASGPPACATRGCGSCCAWWSHVHVRDPRRVAVGGHGRDVIDRLRALVRGQRPPPRSRIERDLAALVLRVVVEGADRMDRRELHEDQLIRPRRGYSPGRSTLQQRELVLADVVPGGCAFATSAFKERRVAGVWSPRSRAASAAARSAARGAGSRSRSRSRGRSGRSRATPLVDQASRSGISISKTRPGFSRFISVQVARAQRRLARVRASSPSTRLVDFASPGAVASNSASASFWVSTIRPESTSPR